MPVRPTDMQQIFSKESLVEKVQHNMDKRHQQESAAIQQNQVNDISLKKAKEPSKDDKLGKNPQKNLPQQKHPEKNKKNKKKENSDNTSPKKTGGSIIDIMV